MKKIVWENPDNSIEVTALEKGVDIDESIFRLVTRNQEQRDLEIAEHGAPITPLLNHAGNTEDSALPNSDGTIVEDYFIENGMAVKKPVPDNIRHLRGSWRWDGFKIVENAIIAKSIRANNVRAVRNQLLADSDSLEFSLTGQVLADAKSYRDNLRGLGVDIDLDPENVNFPIRS